MRSSLFILVAAVFVVLTSCVDRPRNAGDDRPPPLLSEAEIGTDEDGLPAPVRRAQPLLRRTDDDRVPIHRPTDRYAPGLSDTYSAPAAVQPARPHLADGDRIGRRTGRLCRDEADGWVFEFRTDTGTPIPPMPVLPSAMLEAMERIVAEQGAGVQFQVSGEITRYRGRNYLLLRQAVVENAAPADDSNG